METKPTEQPIGSLPELHALLKDFDTAMLVTITSEGRPRACLVEMQDPAEAEGCDLWFVTAGDPTKADELVRERQVTVCLYRHADRAWVSISAAARLGASSAEVRRLWKDDWRLWLPEDADGAIGLLKLDIERAEYWPPEGGRPRLLYARGAAPAGDENRKRLVPPKRFG